MLSRHAYVIICISSLPDRLLNTSVKPKEITLNVSPFCRFSSLCPPKFPSDLSNKCFHSRNHAGYFLSAHIFPDVLWSHPLLMTPRPCLLPKANFTANLQLLDIILVLVLWHGLHLFHSNPLVPLFLNYCLLNWWYRFCLFFCETWDFESFKSSFSFLKQ